MTRLERADRARDAARSRPRDRRRQHEDARRRRRPRRARARRRARPRLRHVRARLRRGRGRRARAHRRAPRSRRRTRSRPTSRLRCGASRARTGPRTTRSSSATLAAALAAPCAPLVVNDAFGGLRTGAPDNVGHRDRLRHVQRDLRAKPARGARSTSASGPTARAASTSGTRRCARSTAHGLDLGPATALTERALALFEADDVLALLHAFTRREDRIPLRHAERLTPVLLDLADEGDAVAAAIVRTSGGRLGDQARSARPRASACRSPGARVVLAGGVMQHPSTSLAGAILAGLPGAVPVRTSRPPLLGALLLGYDALGVAHGRRRARQEPRRRPRGLGPLRCGAMVWPAALSFAEWLARSRSPRGSTSCFAHGRFWLADQRLDGRDPERRRAGRPSPRSCPRATKRTCCRPCCARSSSRTTRASCASTSSTTRAPTAPAASATSSRSRTRAARGSASCARRRGRRAGSARCGRSRAASPRRARPDAAPELWWLTDADVVHAPDTLRRLAAKAEAERTRSRVADGEARERHAASTSSSCPPSSTSSRSSTRSRA